MTQSSSTIKELQRRNRIHSSLKQFFVRKPMYERKKDYGMKLSGKVNIHHSRPKYSNTWDNNIVPNDTFANPDKHMDNGLK